MHNRLRAVLALSLATACVLSIAAAAAAKRTTHSELRVEATKKTLDPGTNYSNGAIRSRNGRACGAIDDRRERLRGANAMGIVGHGARANRRLAPFRTSDTFDFGLIVCQIGDFKGFENRFWLLKVNHEAPSVGADQVRVGRRDEVLWYLSTDNGPNSGDELDLRGVPVRAKPGQEFGVKVVGFSFNGAKSPVEGAKVRGAGPLTGPNGTTTVTARSKPGTMLIRAKRGKDIPSAPVEICVKRNLSRCPKARGETFVGTGRGDAIRGTPGPDLIRARGGQDVVRAADGADRIKVKGGGRDRVNCGPGRDLVKADRDDRIADNCERR